jgi:uncharacterized caspase-like protein
MAVVFRGARSPEYRLRERGVDLSETRNVVAASLAEVAPRAGRHVIAAIGIDRYRHWRQLGNAVSDATGAAALFRQLGFEDVVRPLLDEHATRAAIDELVTDELAHLDANDSLVVFFAGHGGTRTQAVNGREVRTGYLIPVDAADDARRVASWIELDGWLRRIALLPPRHIVVILDACYSGIALSSAVRWGRDSGALPALPFAAANARMSRRILTSARDDERALDSGPVHGHSLFTGCLIEALTGGVLAVGEREGRPVAIAGDIGHYVRRRVHTYEGRPGWQQTPDFGTFDFDDRGEMLIPLLRGAEPTDRSKSLARGSAEEIAAAAAATVAIAPVASAAADPPTDSPSVQHKALRLRRWMAPLSLTLGVSLVLFVLGRAGHRGAASSPDDAGQASGLHDAGPIVDRALSRVDPAWSPSDHVGIDAGAPSPVAPGEVTRVDAGVPAMTALPGRTLRRERAAAAASSRMCPTRIEKPRGAEASWNGAVARVPGDLSLPCGTSVPVMVRKLHYVDKEVAITGGSGPVSVSLEKLSVIVEIRSTPADAAITVSGRWRGTTPAKLKLAEFETSTVTITKDGYAPVTRKVTPTEDGAVVDAVLTLLGAPVR